MHYLTYCDLAVNVLCKLTSRTVFGSTARLAFCGYRVWMKPVQNSITDGKVRSWLVGSCKTPAVYISRSSACARPLGVVQLSVWVGCSRATGLPLCSRIVRRFCSRIDHGPCTCAVAADASIASMVHSTPPGGLVSSRAGIDCEIGLNLLLTRWWHSTCKQIVLGIMTNPAVLRSDC